MNKPSAIVVAVWRQLRSAPRAQHGPRDCCMRCVVTASSAGVVTLCIGGGQGIALALEAL